MSYRQIIIIGLIIGIFVLNTGESVSQNPVFSANQSKKYARFSTDFLARRKDTSEAMKVASLWIKTAKSEQNHGETAKAYKAFMHIAKKDYRMIYADSLLAEAIATKNNEVIGGAYLTIGTGYYSQKNNTKALQSYLKAEAYIARTQDAYLSHKISYAIAQTNYHLGYYNEGIALFRKCITYFKEESVESYLNALHGIGLCYHQIGRYDLSSYNNQLGIQISNEEDYQDLIPYFNNSEGFNKYRLGKHKESIELLTNSLPALESRKDHTAIALTLMYIGKNWLTKQNEDKAYDHFLRANQTIAEQQIIHPYLRENFEQLIRYHKNRQDGVQRQLYSDKLIEFDNVLNKEFRHLVYKMHKEYNTNLPPEKEVKIAPHKSNKTSYAVGLCAAAVLAGGFFIAVRKRKIKKAANFRLEPTIVKLEELEAVDGSALKKMSLENQQLIVSKLEEFEIANGFVDKSINLSTLATKLGTNSRYASAIIGYYRGKNVANYLNDLKIDYLVNLLDEDPEFRKYTNKVLAEKIGFGSTQIFTKAFKKRIGKSPNDYLDDL